MVRKSPHQSPTLTKTPPLLITKYRIQFALVFTFLMLRVMKCKKYVFQTYIRLYLTLTYTAFTHRVRAVKHDTPRSRAERKRQVTLLLLLLLLLLLYHCLLYAG